MRNVWNGTRYLPKTICSVPSKEYEDGEVTLQCFRSEGQCWMTVIGAEFVRLAGAATRKCWPSLVTSYVNAELLSVVWVPAGILKSGIGRSTWKLPSVFTWTAMIRPFVSR